MPVGFLPPPEAEKELSRAIQAGDKGPAGTNLAELASRGPKPLGWGQQSGEV